MEHDDRVEFSHAARLLGGIRYRGIRGGRKTQRQMAVTGMIATLLIGLISLALIGIIATKLIDADEKNRR